MVAKNASSIRKIRYHSAQTVNSTYAMARNFLRYVTRHSKQSYDCSSPPVLLLLPDTRCAFPTRTNPLCSLLSVLAHPWRYASSVRIRHGNEKPIPRGIFSTFLLRPLPLTDSLSCEIGFYPGLLVFLSYCPPSPLNPSKMYHFFDTTTHLSSWHSLQTNEQSRCSWSFIFRLTWINVSLFKRFERPKFSCSYSKAFFKRN